MNEGFIDIVRVDELGARLGFSEHMNIPLSNLSKDFQDFLMEREDAPVFRYIYRNFRPLRHLEFGTWEGFGVVLCAKECPAEIWTVNAPAGEVQEGTTNPVYVRRFRRDEKTPEGAAALKEDPEGGFYQTDTGAFIGWLYRDAGYAERVHQILCDSREWDSRAFRQGFFDSVLIDGGHAPDVVKNDTGKALTLLRPGGICLWHDFCPDPGALRKMPASRGVVRAIVDNIAGWRPYFSDVFWVWPTFILVGVRGSAFVDLRC
jgi:predicted O-methyltransferase YrrM